MPHRLLVRCARVDDVSDIFRLMQPHVDNGTLLARDEDDICQHLQEFMVGCYDGQLVGVAALHIYTRQLAEVRSLVVDAAYRRHGLGRLLLESCETVAMRHGVTDVFALTYVSDFFLRAGYAVVPKESLPHKIWTACIHCDKFPRCDETAVRKRLRSAGSSAARVPPILDRYQP